MKKAVYLAQKQAEFKDVKFDFLEEMTVYLNEGEYHKGEASIIRFIGRFS